MSYLLLVLGDVEDSLEGEEGLLELLQPLRLGHLTPLEHLRHVFDVLRVVSVEVLQLGLVGVARPVHRLLRLGHAVLQLLELKRRRKTLRETFTVNPLPLLSAVLVAV